MPRQGAVPKGSDAGHSICVCICTHKRPELLERLLLELPSQRSGDLLPISIVIVDNDRFESARQTAESFIRQALLPASYHVEPEQNISLARNKAVRNARADFLAFIDDDELPGDGWLETLYQNIGRYNCDGVLGPVLPHFETPPPSWVLKGHFFERPAHESGHVLDWQNTRTGNALLRRSLFENGEMWFDPAYGSGGEDRDFFRRKIAEGHVFVWSNEAPVFETVPPARWRKRTLIRRALLRGKMAFVSERSRPLSVLKSAIAIVIYTISLPLCILGGYHVFMKYLIKDCDHIGKVAAYLGITLVNEKYVEG